MQYLLDIFKKHPRSQIIKDYTETIIYRTSPRTHSSRSSTKSSASIFLNFLSWLRSLDLYCSTVWLSTPSRTSMDFIYVCMFFKAYFIFTTGEVSVIVPECSFVFAYDYREKYLNLFQFLADQPIVLVHFLHGCTQVVEM